MIELHAKRIGTEIERHYADGEIPLVAASLEAVDRYYIQAQMQELANNSGKTIRLVRFDLVDETDA